MVEKIKMTSALKLAILRLKQTPVLKFENTEIDYKGKKECAYRKILEKFMEVNNAEVFEIPSFGSPVEAILKCHKWFMVLNKCPYLKHQEKKDVRDIFYLTVGNIAGFYVLADFEGIKKNEEECKIFGRNIISVLIHENLSPPKNTPVISSFK
jgi:hypothetical protein